MRLNPHTPPGGPPPPPAQWATHKASCKKPSALNIIRPSLAAPSYVIGADFEGRALHPGCQLAPAAVPAELAALLRTFLAAGDRPRASGVELQVAAAGRLTSLALASVADSLAIVSTEGLLQRVEQPGTNGRDRPQAEAAVQLPPALVRCGV